MARRSMSDPVGDNETIGIATQITGEEYRTLTDYLVMTENKETGKPYNIKDFLHSLVCRQLEKIRTGKRIKI